MGPRTRRSSHPACANIIQVDRRPPRPNVEGKERRMCGIAGIVVRQNGLDRWEVIKQMTRRVRHRGPDDEGFYEQGRVALGHRRLSIIDLSAAGHQPMESADGRYVITYNGEVYNYL